MKTKIKIIMFVFIAPIILGAFFIFSRGCFADKSLIISAVQIAGDDANDDFIEIYNPSCDDVDISGWKIRKKTASGAESSIKVISGGTTIKAKSYFLWSNSGFAEKIGADQSTGAILSDNYSVALVSDNEVVDSITWGSNTNPFSGSFLYPENLEKYQALFRDADNKFSIKTNYSPRNSSFIDEAELEACPKEEPATIPANYSADIRINELLPDPDKDGEEYIELFNDSNEKIELGKWSLHDASKSGEYIFSSVDSVDAKDYFAIYKSDFKFALNNGGDESVTLFNPDGEVVFKVEYKGSKKGISYSFDGEDWHWSKFLTPGEENKFEKIPKGDLKIDEDVYVNVFANFEIGGLSKKAKVIWDFGDGHKSYLQKTKHKYKGTGKYEAGVKYSEGSEDVIKNFIVEVKKIPHPEVKIIAVNANPVGSDTENETITLQNKSKKEVNLNGWSIATGWKKLTNHPILIDLEIKAGKKKEITREFSKFTLNNKKAEIELRYPDGKVADDLKYNKKKDSIAEGELYIKENKKWKWENKNVESIKHDASSINAQNIEIVSEESINDEQETAPEEDIASKPLFERENKLAFNQKNFFKINLANNYPRVLGAETFREAEDAYFFTSGQSQQEHYAIIFIKNLFTIINFKINTLINNFFN